MAGGNFFSHRSVLSSTNPPPQFFVDWQQMASSSYQESIFIFIHHPQGDNASAFISFTLTLLAFSLTLLSTTQEVLMVKENPRFICQNWKANHFFQKKNSIWSCFCASLRILPQSKVLHYLLPAVSSVHTSCESCEWEFVECFQLSRWQPEPRVPSPYSFSIS